MLDQKTFSGVRLEYLTFNDDSKIEMSNNTILTLTGPNNCGKSQCLRDVSSNYFDERSKMVVLSDLAMHFVGSKDALKCCFTDEKGELFDASRTAWFRMDEALLEDPFELLRAAKKEGSYIFREVLKYFMSYLNTSSRLIGFSDGLRRGLAYSIPDKYSLDEISFKDVYEDTSLEDSIYRIVEASFGKGILLNKFSFKKSSFHYMSQSEAKGRNDLGQPSYARWFEAQPALEDQGDGIISFCNILISILTNRAPLLLIDEPEAFLHTPQIRALAKIIAQNSNKETQIILSTHSHDLVQGLIDYGKDRVIVARLSRIFDKGKEINIVKKLNSNDISELWQDPLLRTSDVLSSLFHHVAVIVEGDSDARFFRAMLDAMETNTFGDMLNIRFFHCNGKDRIPKIARALRAIGVPTLSVVDIDVLDDEAKFANFIESFGGTPGDFEGAVKTVIRFVTDHRMVSTSSDAKELVDEVFSSLDPKRPIPKVAASKVYDAVRASSVWSLAKRSGEAFFTRGEAHNAFREVFTKARELGILINNFGELENLCKDIEARKSEWLNAVVQRDLLKDPELADARSFTKTIKERCLLKAGLKGPLSATPAA